MTDSAHAPRSGDHIDNEKLIVGYAPLSDFLTSEGFRISTSSLQKLGMPSAGGAGPPREGFWGNLPAFRPSRALDWARSRIRPSRGKATASSAPIADLSTEPTVDSPAKGAFGTPPCGPPSPADQHATTADTVA
jgi:hypothetical protein